MEENFLTIQESLANAIADEHLDKNLLKHFVTMERFAFQIKANILRIQATKESVEIYHELMTEIIKFQHRLIFKITAFSEEALPVQEKGMLTDLEMAAADSVMGLNKDFHSATLDYDIDSMKRKLDENAFKADKTRELAEVHCNNLIKIKSTFHS
jgi:hypothetical protein